MNENFKYLVTFGGGLGENVWDGETEVEAENIFDALSKAKNKLDNILNTSNYTIFSIEQEE
jgi:hypothetical protein